MLFSKILTVLYTEGARGLLDHIFLPVDGRSGVRIVEITIFWCLRGGRKNMEGSNTGQRRRHDNFSINSFSIFFIFLRVRRYSVHHQVTKQCTVYILFGKIITVL